MSRLEIPYYSELGGFGGVVAVILGLMLIGIGIGIFSGGLTRYRLVIGGTLFIGTGGVAIRSSITERRTAARAAIGLESRAEVRLGRSFG